jgi:uncharacterized integral membrane protein
MESKPLEPGTSSPKTESPRSGSALGSAAGFAARHPSGLLQVVFFLLVGIIVLQNLEPTTIDVLFWSFPGFPKLVLILFSMVVGAVAWEIARRFFRRGPRDAGAA